MAETRKVYKKRVGKDKYIYKAGDAQFGNRDDAYAYRDKLIANDQAVMQEKQLKQFNADIEKFQKYKNITDPDEGIFADNSWNEDGTPLFDETWSLEDRQEYKVFKDTYNLYRSKVGMDKVQPSEVPTAEEPPEEPGFFSQLFGFGSKPETKISRSDVRREIAGQVNKELLDSKGKKTFRHFLATKNKELGSDFKSMNEYIDALTDEHIKNNVAPGDKSIAQLLEDIQ
jgi:hypothetical protein